VALTSPPLVSALGALVAWINGARFVYWVMDLNPDQAIAAGWLRENSTVSRILSAILQFSLRKADEVIALDRFMATRLAKKGVPASKLSVIPLWSQDDIVEFDPRSAADFRYRHDLTGKFVVMYSGNHSPCHPLTTILDAARLLKDRPEIAFCFVGGGSEFIRVKQFAQQHQLANIRCVAYQPLDALSASLSAGDLHLVVMGDPFVGMVHPSKVYNIIRIGVPFLYIGPARGPIEELRPTASFRHGDAPQVAGYITAASRNHRPAFENHRTFARIDLLQQLTSAVEGKSRQESAQLVRS
jgi:colanic acid biosynthesis glycosyl transferase WcaI